MLEFIVVVKDGQTGSVIHATYLPVVSLTKESYFASKNLMFLAREVNCFNYQPFVNCSFTALIKQYSRFPEVFSCQGNIFKVHLT
jgi:hypothetical protein